MSKVNAKYIVFNNTDKGVNSRVIPANFVPNNYIPAQVSSEGIDKISAHLKGIDAALKTYVGKTILYVNTAADRLAIPAEDKYDRMFVFQLDKNILWFWQASNETWEIYGGESISSVSLDLPVIQLTKSTLYGYKNVLHISISNEGDVISEDTPFGEEDYQDGTEVTLMFLHKGVYTLNLKSKDINFGIIGGDVYLSDYGQSVTFKYINSEKRWFLTSRSN